MICFQDGGLFPGGARFRATPLCREARSLRSASFEVFTVQERSVIFNIRPLAIWTVDIIIPV